MPVWSWFTTDELGGVAHPHPMSVCGKGTPGASAIDQRGPTPGPKESASYAATVPFSDPVNTTSILERGDPATPVRLATKSGWAYTSPSVIRSAIQPKWV